jgi:hypothetical protein
MVAEREVGGMLVPFSISPCQAFLDDGECDCLIRHEAR